MNIIVKTADGRCIVRPDTTWERDNEDFYPQEDISALSYTPVLFARISKPGRSVSARFADRYYDGIGFGVLLYPEDMLDGSETGFACASCLDHSSFLPFPVYDKLTLGQEDNVFVLSRKRQASERFSRIFSYGAGSRKMIEQAIEEATRYIYIRTGDLLAIELQPRERMCSREDGSTQVKALWCGNDLMEFNIVM